MIYLYNKELKNNRFLVYELKNIYGIGFSLSSLFCKQLGVAKNIKISELSKEQVTELLKIIEKSNKLFSTELKKINTFAIKKLVQIKTYRGLRRLKGLPVRGQRTHTNSRTTRKIK